ncbi:MAG: CHASE2 domain-containing protein [Rhodocyclaceae bacterium]|nr:CHASE2 domain-containing protein [Rhodocyclaceae bacterium]
MTGKLVLIGLTGDGIADRRVTALRENVPGIEIQAQVIESLFEGRVLTRPLVDQDQRNAGAGALRRVLRSCRAPSIGLADAGFPRREHRRGALGMS